MLWLNVINYARETQDCLGAGESLGEELELGCCEYIRLTTDVSCSASQDVRLINPIKLKSLTHKMSQRNESRWACVRLWSLYIAVSSPLRPSSVLTLLVSSYHKQTHIACLPDPLIATLLSCCLGYVRLHNTRSV